MSGRVAVTTELETARAAAAAGLPEVDPMLPLDSPNKCGGLSAFASAFCLFACAVRGDAFLWGLFLFVCVCWGRCCVSRGVARARPPVARGVRMS